MGGAVGVDGLGKEVFPRFRLALRPRLEKNPPLSLRNDVGGGLDFNGREDERGGVSCANEGYGKAGGGIKATLS
jgi:hypothetical protein